MSNNLLLVPSEKDTSIIMVPVQAVTQDLVTKTDYLIYVPLASKNTFGTVKIGDGIDVSNGVISVSGHGSVIDSKVDKFQGVEHSKQVLKVDENGFVTTGYASGSIDIYKNSTLVKEDAGYLRYSDDFTVNDEIKGGVFLSLKHPVPLKTSDLTNDGDGYSLYATEEYVNINGGKIDVIKVNGVHQEIVDKTIELTIPSIEGLASETFVNTKTQEVLIAANKHTDDRVSGLIGQAPETLDTLKEIADALAEDQTALDTLNLAIGNKVNKTLKINGKTLEQDINLTAADVGALSSFTETDPTVPAWAKQSNKPEYEYSEIKNTPVIPINNNQLTNGAGYITATRPAGQGVGFISKDNAGFTIYGDSVSENLYTYIINSEGKSGWYKLLDTNGKLYSGHKEVAVKEEVPSVNNPTITIKQGEETKGTFTLNQSNDSIIELDVGGGGSGSNVTLYEGLGQNTDGAMTQKATTDELNKKIEYTEGMTAPVINVLSDYYNKSQSDSRYYTKTESATEMKTIVDSEIAKVKTSYDTQINQINSNKANVGLSNINPVLTSSASTINGFTGTKYSGARICIESWISDDKTRWYRIYNDGWKECGGHWTRTGTSDGNITLTLPLTFSDTNYTILKCNIHLYDSNITGRNFTFWSKTTNSAITYQACNGSNNTGFDFLAFGY